MSSSVFLFRLFPVNLLDISGPEYISLRFSHLYLQTRKRLRAPRSTVPTGSDWLWVRKSFLSSCLQDLEGKFYILKWKLPAFGKFRNTLYMYNSFFSSMRTLAHKKMPQADYFKEMRLFWSSFVKKAMLVIEIVTAICWLTHGIQSSFPLASGIMHQKD